MKYVCAGYRTHRIGTLFEGGCGSILERNCFRLWSRDQLYFDQTWRCVSEGRIEIQNVEKWKHPIVSLALDRSNWLLLLAYAPVRDWLGAGKDAPFYMKFLAGAITGGVGSFVGNPFDVLKTLAQTNKDKSVPLSTMVGNMYQAQGIGGFYRGVEANILRACVLNATKMGVYDLSKGYVTEYTGWSRKDVRTAFCSSFVAGFFMTCTVSPFDRIRTNLMNQPTDKKIYDGFIDCCTKTIQNDGIASLWRGFIPM
jgi:hypothetical protein